MITVSGLIDDYLILWNALPNQYSTFIVPHIPSFNIMSYEFEQPNESLDPFVYRITAISSYTWWSSNLIMNIGILNSQSHVMP